MLGLIIIFIVGKNFYELSLDYGKKKWLYAILGVVSYYAGTFMIGLTIGLYSEITGRGSIDTMNTLMLNLIALPFGILTCYLFYRWLKRKWQKEKQAMVDEIHEINKIGEEY